MSLLRLAKFADENAALCDVGDADFLHERKLGPDVVLDFSDVSEVSVPFLVSLLKGETPESIADRLQGMNDAVDHALAEWADVAGGEVTVIERPRERPKRRVPKAAPKYVPIEREPTADVRFTPSRLINRLRSSLRGYIESAYPLSDPTLVRARRKLLETEADGHLLAQEPFIETTTRYKSSPHAYNEIDLPDHIGGLFDRLAKTPPHADPTETILYPSMYDHQERAFKSFFVDGSDIVVATGTGSGKTECFLLPILGTLYDEAVNRPASFKKPGVRALILYPMNALVNDQLARLRLLLGEPAVADDFRALDAKRCPLFGMYTGRTPYPGMRKGGRDSERVAPLLEYYLGMEPNLKARLARLGRYPAKDLDAFYAKGEAKRATYKSGKKKGKQYTKHNWPQRLHTVAGDRELLTRQEMVHGVGTNPGHSPDVLVTNYSMLEYMLLRPFERPIFAETQQWLNEDDENQLILVLDEAHMYRGAKGAEVAFLLRRLRARLGIHGRPEKLRVIATSASLGSDESALQTIRCFIADLVGKAPEDFTAITGTREVPEPAASPTAQEAAMLASLDLEAINNAFSTEELAESLAPVFEHYAAAVDGTSEASILASLHSVLSGKAYINLLIREAADSAVSLADLAERVIPGHAENRKALEALLALGTLARKKVDSPGLVPTRVHGMFRGLHGLYACMNRKCPGRQAEPGADALVGKLFTQPRTNCDVCGARVFELASCRSCGSPYILAYTESGALDRLDFLWGEMEGNLVRFELLPMAPRYPERTEELVVHIKTGYLDTGLQYPEEETRSLHICHDGEDKRAVQFDRCVMCQPSPTARSRISDFRTRGEQSFTALIEAQFSEQPPQNTDPKLPNHGRKVLVFSDGRQKAARLAPALEHSHARDLFRQVIAIASHELREQCGHTGMHYLYPGVAWLCGNRGYDLFPSTDEVEFHEHLRRVQGKTLGDAIKRYNRSGLRPTKSFAQALFSELTDRYYSLPSLALGTIEEDPDLDTIFDNFPSVGLDADAIRTLFRAWVRLHLERRSFMPDGAERRDLGEGWSGPVGINPEQERHVLPNNFRDFLELVFDSDTAAVDEVARWFKGLVRNSELLDFEGDRYYLRPLGLSLNLKLDNEWLRCTDCGRIHPEGLADTCPGCCGALVDADVDYLDARTGFYRDQVLRAFRDVCLEPFGLSAAEHSAQLTARPDESAFNKVEEYELRFQDIALDGKSPIDILSCTTTMEVGIDIGALSGVALRNVPPHVANYQQRAGRAGRRARSIASVITYAHGTSHDAHFFEHPDAIISGDVQAPIVYIENQQVLARHIHAYLLQRFFHEKVPADTTSNAYVLFESLGTVDQFLSEAHACSLKKLESWLNENEVNLKEEIRRWVPVHSYGLGEAVAGIDVTIDKSIRKFCSSVRDVLPIGEYVKRDELEGIELEALQRRLDETLLETLIGHAVLPRYAFPMDVVSFWVPKPRRLGDPPGPSKFDYDPQRDLQIALSDYAPGRSMTIDKWRFQSAALFSPSNPTPGATLARRQPYTACRDCTFVSLAKEATDLIHCPCCGSDQLTHSAFITPSGFAPDINLKREVDRGEAITYAGMTERARLEIQDPPTEWERELYADRLLLWTGPRMLAVVNKGVGDRGFRVCPDCGRSEPEYGPGYTNTKLTKAGTPAQHSHPLKEGVVCSGVANGPFYLGHRFPTDALLLRLLTERPFRLGTPGTQGLLSRAARMAMTSLVEAIGLAASRELQIDEGELSGWWAPVLGAKIDQAQLYLYDLLPGGAGYARAVGEKIEDVLSATEAILTDCTCSSSCYRCLRHYGNNYIHMSLDRHLAVVLLRHIRGGEIPSIAENAKAGLLAGVRECLLLQRTPFEESAKRGDVVVPLVVTAETGELWVDVCHPLVDPAHTPSAISLAAQMNFSELVELDAFTLVHDLPGAMAGLNISSQGAGSSDQ